MKRLVMAPSLAAAATLLLGLQASRAPDVRDLGTLGGPFAFATAINNRQQIVGQSVDAAETRLEAFLWEDGVMRGLSTADFHFEIAQDINDRGQIVGAGRDPGGRFVTLRWDDGVLTELPLPPGATSCGAEAINDRGDIVGACDQVHEWGVVWPRDGGVVGLGPVPDGWSASPVDINERGDVLGLATDAAGVQQSWIWKDGSATIITNLPGDGAPLFFPTALNNRAQVAGWGVDLRARRAVVLDRGRIEPLPLPPGVTGSLSDGMNDRGDVVGAAELPTGFRAAVWTREQARVLPLLPGTTSSSAADINDRGVAIGNYATMPGETRALVWPRASTRIPRDPGGVE